jgi:hypothetical protein
MARLEELTQGASVKGILADGLVTVVGARWIGDSVVELTYKDASGHLSSELLYRDREPALEIASAGRPWSFDGDGAALRLVSEAHRIHLAHLFDPLLAVHTSLVDPLPHQITAVYQEMLSRQPLRFLLADDPGAGKTIMAGLLIKELRLRGDLHRCLIVCPGSLAEQWQDELDQKFHLPFEILTNDKLESARSGNWLAENPLVICRLDKLSRSDELQTKLEQTDWDLIVCDEAHKMSATFFGGEVKYTRRYQLGKLLSRVTRHFLLMTATPHNGKEADFQLFMALLDSDRFEGKFRDGVHLAETSDLMRRLVKEQPGESVATFGDALRRLTDQASHLYVDGRRYWFSTQPSVTRLAQDRAAQLADDEVIEEIRRRLRAEASHRGDFAHVHVCPVSAGDVPDEQQARLVILDPQYPHSAKTGDGPARALATTLLDQRGSGPRIYRNTLVFLAPDRARLAELEQAARQYLAWRSIEAEREALDLSAFQANQAKTKREQWDETVRQRVPETYQWLLVPIHLVPESGDGAAPGTTGWEEIRVQGDEALAVRASRKLIVEEHLITRCAGARLRHELDRVPLWRGNDVSLKQLAADFAQYLYLPRLQSPDVLLAAARDGIGSPTWQKDAFAYAEGWDDAGKRYRGLSAGADDGVTASLNGLLVKPEVAAEQREREKIVVIGPDPDDEEEDIIIPPPPQARRFHGSVSLDANRAYSEAEKVAREVIQHLSALVGAQVEVTLELRALVPDGAPDHVVRTVTENCRTLKFCSYGFEDS